MSNHNKIAIACLGILCLISACNSSQRAIDETRQSCKLKKPELILLLKNSRDYWVKDSLGKSGYRQILAIHFLNSKSILNLTVTELKTYLGEPKYSYIYKSVTYFRYFIAEGEYFEVKLSGEKLLAYKILTTEG